MDIAKLDNGNIVVGNYKELFPNTSFPITGPNDDFFTENNCLKVSQFKTHDRATEMLVGCDPYEENGMVYTVTVQTRPEPEVIEASQGADSV
jgi:hypothetical protein